MFFYKKTTGELSPNSILFCIQLEADQIKVIESNGRADTSETAGESADSNEAVRPNGATDDETDSTIEVRTGSPIIHSAVEVDRKVIDGASEVETPAYEQSPQPEGDEREDCKQLKHLPVKGAHCRVLPVTEQGIDLL